MQVAAQLCFQLEIKVNQYVIFLALTKQLSVLRQVIIVYHVNRSHYELC